MPRLPRVYDLIEKLSLLNFCFLLDEWRAFAYSAVRYMILTWEWIIRFKLYIRFNRHSHENWFLANIWSGIYMAFITHMLSARLLADLLRRSLSFDFDSIFSCSSAYAYTIHGSWWKNVPYRLRHQEASIPAADLKGAWWSFALQDPRGGFSAGSSRILEIGCLRLTWNYESVVKYMRTSTHI
jgi:hypothetical protein